MKKPLNPFNTNTFIYLHNYFVGNVGRFDPFPFFSSVLYQVIHKPLFFNFFGPTSPTLPTFPETPCGARDLNVGRPTYIDLQTTNTRKSPRSPEGAPTDRSTAYHSPRR